MIMIMSKLLIRQDGGQGHGRQDIRTEGCEGAGLGEESQDRFVLFLVVLFKEGWHIYFVRMCKGKLFRMFKWVLGGHTHRSASALGRGEDPVLGLFPK